MGVSFALKLLIVSPIMYGAFCAFSIEAEDDMAKNLAGKTYEVLTADGDRWIFESTFDVRSSALEHAEELLGQPNHDGVRVTSESERSGDMEVIFEERHDRDKAITLVAVDEAPMCDKLIDFYRFPARRTAGKLLRNLLDDQGMTALELAFDAGQMMMFERNDKLFAPAVQRIGTIQAKAAGTKPMERNDVIFSAFANIKERAKKAPNGEKYAALLKAKGLNALIDGATQWEKSEEKRLTAILGALAGRLSGRGGWDGKLQLLILLTKDDPHAQAVTFVDEIAAEILDGTEAVMEVLAGQPDAATANLRLVQLSRGNIKPPRNPMSCIIDLNDMMARLALPLTRQVLLERVASGIGGIRPLTKEGDNAERKAFTVLVRELVDEDGLSGGACMCDAIVGRARMTLKSDVTDLTFEQAIGQLMDLMPNRAVRLGFLLDLITSPGGRKEKLRVLEALDRIAQQITLLASLIPDTSSPETAARVVGKLKGRLDSEYLPEDRKQNLNTLLDGLITKKAEGGKAGSKGDTNKYGMKDGSLNKNDQTGERKSIAGGEMVFEEGDAGDMAYLIISGEVEIFRKSGNQERVLATLGRGEIIGEMSLIDNSPRMASARAMSDSQFSIITHASLQQRLDRLEENDRVLRRLITVLVSRIRGQAESPG